MRALAVAATLLLGACDGPVPAWSIAVHGGARMLAAAEYSPEEQAAIRRDLAAALEAGAAVLRGGGASIDAVQSAVVALEDSPWFNAGHGAVYTHAGTHELDAAIMDGATRRAGAVAGVRRVRNPIVLARLVMAQTPHVLIVGDGADALAAEHGIPRVDPSYFGTERRWRQLQEALEKQKASPSRSAREAYFGTVGAVARDAQGRLAAATSTGGMTNKRAGRVGDAPLIGAGTYADDACAVSATGHGEYFIRYVVAHDICSRARDIGVTLPRAARRVIQEVLRAAGGDGGVIALDAHGALALEFNTNAMLRGLMTADASARVAIHADEALGPP